MASQLAAAGVNNFVGDVKFACSLMFSNGDFNDPSQVVPSQTLNAETLATLVAYCGAFTVVVLTLQNLLLPRAVAMLLGQRAKDPALQVKCSVALRDLLFYAVSSTFLVLAYWQMEWVWPDSFPELSHMGVISAVPRVIRFTLFFEVSWYLVSVIFILMDPVRKDTYVMALHHVVTVVLILVCWLYGRPHLGVVVLLLHNVSDVFLGIAKVANYAKAEPVDSIGFAFTLLTWAVFRFYGFGRLLVMCYEYGVFVPNARTPDCALVYLLTALMPLHIYWFALMLKVAFRSLAGKGLEDVRESVDDADGAQACTKKSGGKSDKQHAD